MALFAMACGGSLSTTSESDVAGLYVVSPGTDRESADRFAALLTVDDPTLRDPSGFPIGVSAFARVSSSIDGFGARIGFNTALTDSLIQNLESKAASLGLSAERVFAGDLWPDCEDEPDCDNAKLFPE